MRQIINDMSDTFQFYHSAIKNVFSKDYTKTQLNFNSIIVRLKIKEAVEELKHWAFQFYHSAIKKNHEM